MVHTNMFVYIHIYIILYMPDTLKKHFKALTSNLYNSLMKVYYYPYFSDEEAEAQRTK